MEYYTKQQKETTDTYKSWMNLNNIMQGEKECL